MFICRVLSGREVESQAVAVREGELCLICDTLLNYVEEGLNQQVTVEEVEKLLNDVCELFPTDLTSEVISLSPTSLSLVLSLRTKRSRADICFL